MKQMTGRRQIYLTKIYKMVGNQNRPYHISLLSVEVAFQYDLVLGGGSTKWSNVAMLGIQFRFAFIIEKTEKKRKKYIGFGPQNQQMITPTSSYIWQNC